MDEVKIGEILEPDSEARRRANEERVRKGFWGKVRRAATRIPFIDEVVASYYCAMDPDTPSRVRMILLGALAYFILPLDSLPDFLIGFGFTDDIAVLSAAFAAVRGSVTEAHRAAARQALAEEDLPDDDKSSAKGETINA